MSRVAAPGASPASSSLAFAALTLALALAWCAVVTAPVMAAAAAVDAPVMSPAEIVALGEASDGRTVTVRGEALGETLRDGLGGSWVNVLGDGVALGLWGGRDSFEAIEEYGGYHRRGAIVEAIGVYNAACDRHGGDRDVHVESLRVIAPGEPIERPLQLWKLAGGLLMAAGAGALWLSYRRRVQRTY